ncbi:MAG: hypothetical protein KAJ19_21385 [Gammaproteobacteria bacterium]|nr:hypothetical protein [Gammaproteobacteria bacterium]
MKVKELIDFLQKQDADALVILCEDAAGNGYRPLRVIDETFYTPEGDCGRGEVVEEGADRSDDPDFTKAVCLWP